MADNCFEPDKLNINLHTGGADREAESLRNKIMTAKDRLAIGRNTYYISPNGHDDHDGKTPENAIKTLLQLRMFPLRSGDAVLFERGGVWRANETVFLRGGVKYGAYGIGAKPAIYGSERNYAQKNLWHSCDDNLWKLNLPLEEAGLIVLNPGEHVGIRKQSLDDIATNGDYFHDVDKGKLYFYFDKGNPADIYREIEIGTTKDILFAQNINSVTIDNLCLRYASALAINCGNNKEINITNCEIGWIGGGIWRDGIRYGNAIQFWFRCYNIYVEHCWIYQIYDAALTFQGSDLGEAQFTNISFAENLIESCSMNIEFWAGPPEMPDGVIHNIDIKENILRFAGYGWGGQQRPDLGSQAFILGWGRRYKNLQHFYIEKNIFDCADCHMIWTLSPSQQEGLAVQDNTYYQKKNSGRNSYMEIVRGSGKNATNQFELEMAVLEFEKSPKLVKWIDD